MASLLLWNGASSSKIKASPKDRVLYRTVDKERYKKNTVCGKVLKALVLVVYSSDLALQSLLLFFNSYTFGMDFIVSPLIFFYEGAR